MCIAMWRFLAILGLTAASVLSQDSVAFYFASEPADTWVTEGAEFTLSCSTSTAAENTWSWLLHESTADNEGVVIEGATSDTLLYGSVSRAFDGRFISCSADIFGTRLISRYALIRVSYLDEEFLQEPNDATAAAGTDHVRLECLPPGGNPEPYVTWLKNGEEVDLANTFVDPYGGLNILNVAAEDAGSYACAANSFQDHPPIVSRTAELTVDGSSTPSTFPVMYDVSFARAKYKITARKGDSVRVLCGFLGNPTPTFSLSADHTTLSNSVESAVSAFGTWATVTSLEGVSGFKCAAANLAGSQVMNIPVDIQGRLEVAGGVEIEVLEGEGLTLVCSESGGNGDVTYSWYRNGQSLAGESARLLEVLSPERADSGMYQCFAATAHAKEQSSFAVTVAGLQAESVSVTVTSDEFGLVGEELQLSCVGRGNPVPTVTWHKKRENTEQAMAISDITYKKTFTEVLALLHLGPLDYTDDGVEYICKGANTDLYDTSVPYRAESSLTLLVVAPIEPSISLPSTSVVQAGTPLTLICSVEGSPPPKIIWYRNGEVIEGESEERYVTRGEAGLFKCTATNLLGTVEQEVRVQAKPEYSGGEIFLILLITGFLLLVGTVLVLIFIRRTELERRMQEARAKEELLLENERRAVSRTPSNLYQALGPPSEAYQVPGTPNSLQQSAMTPIANGAPVEQGVQQRPATPSVSEAECQTPRPNTPQPLTSVANV